MLIWGSSKPFGVSGSLARPGRPDRAPLGDAVPARSRARAQVASGFHDPKHQPLSARTAESHELEVDINTEFVSPSLRRQRSQRRARLEAIGLSVTAAVVVASAVWAVTWTGSDGVRDQPRADGPSLSPTSPSEAPSPAGTVLELGETFDGSRASSTVVKAQPLEITGELAPADGEMWFGLRVTRCASETQSSAKAPYSRWVVVDDEGETYAGAPGVPEGIVNRLLTTRDFPAGQCRSGWVLVSVPDAVADSITGVRFVPPAGPAAEWQLPGR